MAKFDDLTGRRFGRLLVLEYAGSKKIGGHSRTRWRCQCDCGKTKIVSATHLKTGDTKSCGCLWMVKWKAGLIPPPPLCRKFSEEEEHQIIVLYHQGLSDRTLAKRFSCHPGTIAKIRKRHHVPHRLPTERPRKYPLNEEAFSQLSSEAVFYWLGFLAGDVAANKDRPRLTLTLAIRDKLHVQKLQQFLNTTKPIRIIPEREIVDASRKKVYKSQNFARIVIDSKKLYHDFLGYFGGIPGNYLPNEQLVASRHFWRGMIDADGWISKPSVKKPRIALFGPYQLLELFQQFVTARILTRASIRHNGPNSYKFDLICNPARRLTTLLYKDATIYLERKFQRASQHFLTK